METYIALLRGINISGKNKISMPLLKATFEETGFSNVSTYINSGNVIFSSDMLNKNELIEKCKSLIADKFMLNIPVTIISTKELSKALENAPKWWDIASFICILEKRCFLELQANKVTRIIPSI